MKKVPSTISPPDNTSDNNAPPGNAPASNVPPSNGISITTHPDNTLPNDLPPSNGLPGNMPTTTASPSNTILPPGNNLIDAAGEVNACNNAALSLPPDADPMPALLHPGAMGDKTRSNCKYVFNYIFKCSGVSPPVSEIVATFAPTKNFVSTTRTEKSKKQGKKAIERISSATENCNHFYRNATNYDSIRI